MGIEIWKDVIGYEGLYQVSNYGSIRGIERRVYITNTRYRTVPQRLMTKEVDANGYLVCNISCHGKRKKKKIHRLVAMAFIPNPENKYEVNHIDGDKTNNLISNLEWCTRKENAKHASDNNLYKKPWLGKGGKGYFSNKAVIQYDLNMKFIKEHYSVSDAAKSTDTAQSSISKVANLKRSKANGFIWRFKKN